MKDSTALKNTASELPIQVLRYRWVGRLEAHNGLALLGRRYGVG